MNSTPVCVVQDPRLMHKQLEDNKKYTFGLLQNEFMEACVKKKDGHCNFLSDNSYFFRVYALQCL